MSTTNIVPPFPVFTDSAGAPLDNGFVYVGTANLNPVSNPIAVYWDAALTVVAAQPIRTINGFLSQSGSPGTLFSAVDYSITVKDSKGVQVFTAPEGARAGLGSIVLAATESLTASAGSSIVLQDGSTMTVGTATGTAVTVTMASNARVIGDIVPNVNATQSLGSSTRKWDAQLDVASAGALTVSTTAVVYNDTTTAVGAAGVIGANQQTTIAACGRISAAAAVATNHFNISGAVLNSAGQIDVDLDVAVEDDAVFIGTPTVANLNPVQILGSVIDSGLAVRVLQYESGVLTTLAFSFILVGRPRGGATP